MTRIEPNCTHAHCKCMNIGKQCKNNHYQDCLDKVNPMPVMKSRTLQEMLLNIVRNVQANMDGRVATDILMIESEFTEAVERAKSSERKITLQVCMDIVRKHDPAYGDVNPNYWGKTLMDELQSLLPSNQNAK